MAPWRRDRGHRSAGHGFLTYGTLITVGPALGLRSIRADTRHPGNGFRRRGLPPPRATRAPVRIRRVRIVHAVRSGVRPEEPDRGRRPDRLLLHQTPGRGARRRLPEPEPQDG